MQVASKIELVDRLAGAKSQQNLEQTMAVLHPDFVLETPALGSRVEGSRKVAAALAHFFATFPDYRIEIARRWIDDEAMICRGVASLTMTGERFGVVPSGRRAIMPVHIEFEFRDGLISRECFSYDLSVLCAQSGVSCDAVRRHLFGRAWEGKQ